MTRAEFFLENPQTAIDVKPKTVNIYSEARGREDEGH